MKNKIKISEEQQKLLNTGATVHTPENGIYHYLPFWYKETENKDIFEIIPLGKLPIDLVNAIDIMRDYIKK